MRHLGGLDKQKKKNQAKGTFLYLILLAFVSIDYHKVSLVSTVFIGFIHIVFRVFHMPKAVNRMHKILYAVAVRNSLML